MRRGALGGREGAFHFRCHGFGKQLRNGVAAVEPEPPRLFAPRGPGGFSGPEKVPDRLRALLVIVRIKLALKLPEAAFIPP